MNVDGTKPNNITKDEVEHLYPTWSPDGNRIVYQSDEKGGWNIFLVNSDGSNETCLTCSQQGAFYSPAWSPDGNQIAFTVQTTKDESSREICVMNIDGVDMNCLTNNSYYEDNPAWSPDGKMLAFTSAQDGDWDIYTMNMDGSGVRQVVNNTGKDYFPAWQPK